MHNKYKMCAGDFEGCGKYVIFVEMEKLNRFISIMLLVLIGCVTVFQCHHHDASGNAFFLTIGDREVTAGLCHGDCHAGADSRGNQGGDRDCGLHVDVAPLIEKGAVCASMGQSLAVVPDEFCFSFDLRQSMPELLWQNDGCVAVADGYGHAGLLRGPPFV